MQDNKKVIKEGDLVTVELGEYQMVSNTYLVARKLETESLLSHPLAPDCYILKADKDLNNSYPTSQNQVEKTLFFARANVAQLGLVASADLDALCYFFVVRKLLTSKQRYDLSNICGKIAAIMLGQNISSAIITIKQNKALLDEYNYSLMNAVKNVIDDPRSMENKGQRFTIFNIAGFVLAQLSNSNGEKHV